ncbi:MAG: SCO family protein [Pseudomonadota bacterium]
MSAKVAAIASGVAGLLVGGSFLAATVLAPSNDLQACLGSSVAGGDVGGPFELVSETGETVTQDDVITGATLVYFGYTFCPDVCPMDVNRNAIAMEILEEDMGTEIDGLFVTIDPARDTPEYLAEFTEWVHPRLTGLTGSEAQVAEAARAYRAYYRKVDGDDPDFYLMDHSTLTYLMHPEEGFVTFFRRDMSPEDMADQIDCVVDTLA